MSTIRCNYCGERHDPWDECASGRREKVLKKESKMSEKKQPVPRQRPEGMKVHWRDGRVTAVLGQHLSQGGEIAKVQPLYLAQGASMVSYTDAAEQLAFTLHGTTINQLDDKTAEQVRHAAFATVNAAIGVH